MGDLRGCSICREGIVVQMQERAQGIPDIGGGELDSVREGFFMGVLSSVGYPGDRTQ